MEEDWRSQRQREKIIQHLDNVIRNCKVPLNIPGDARQVENAVFMKASNKEEYMHYVSKIIYHASSGAAVVGNQMTCSPQQGQMGSMQYGGMPTPGTPMGQVHPEAMGVNDLRAMPHQQQQQQQQQAQPRPPNQMYHGLRPEMQRMIRPMQQNNMQVHHMQGSSVNPMPNMQMSAQPQAQNVMMLLQSSGANRQPMAPMQSRPVPSELQLFVQQLPINVRQQLSQLPPEEQSEMLKKLYESKRWQDQQAQQQRQIQQMSQGQMHQNMLRQPPQAYATGRPAQPMQMMQPMMQGAPAVRYVEQPPTPYSRPPSTPMPATPAPQQVAVQPASVSSVPVASPNFTPMSQYPTPSPSSGPPTMGPSPLYAMETSPAFAPTPGAPVSSKGPSPSGTDIASTSEQPGYREKVIELLVYLDTLKRIIDQQQREGTGNAAQVQKFQRMVDILEGRQKTSMDVLLKCEETLKRLCQKTEDVKERNRNICQPLLEALNFALKQRSGKGLNLSSCFDHLILPTMAEQKLCSPEWMGLVKEKTKEVLAAEGNDGRVPISIRREVALLDPKFQVKLEPDELPLKSSWKNLHVVCTLRDSTLPSVPPLHLRIPLNYPQALPKYDMEKTGYGGSALLLSVRKSLLALSYDTASFKTISSLLNHWVLAVRKASSLIETNDESALSELLSETEQGVSSYQRDEVMQA